MAVGISIGDYTHSPHVGFDDDDPVYWYLFPYFEETWQATGEMIDLYGDAEFAGDDILALSRILEKAVSDAQARDGQWIVTIGYRGDADVPIERTVTKASVLACIRTLQQTLDSAYNLHRKVICLGD